jgi:hypothetical protein
MFRASTAGETRRVRDLPGRRSDRFITTKKASAQQHRISLLHHLQRFD